MIGYNGNGEGTMRGSMPVSPSRRVRTRITSAEDLVHQAMMYDPEYILYYGESYDYATDLDGLLNKVRDDLRSHSSVPVEFLIYD